MTNTKKGNVLAAITQTGNHLLSLFSIRRTKGTREHKKASLALERRLMSKQDRYIKKRALAQGGMGIIYKTEDIDLGRVSAMKVALSQLVNDPELAREFTAEAKITAQLEHPNIVPVHDLGMTKGGELFFTMKLIEGESLRAILEQLAAQNPEYQSKYDRHKLLLAFRSVCEALAFAHSRGVIHRDVKPGNIMLGKFGETLLLDWGIAMDIGDEKDLLSDSFPVDDCAASVFSSRGLGERVRGTPAYMAPEQAQGRVEEIDRQTDIFLLGATLFHILTYRPPFTADTSGEALSKAAMGSIPWASDTNPRLQVPQELSRIVAKAASRLKSSRYKSVEELIDDLDAWMSGKVLYERRSYRAGEALMLAGEIGKEAYLIIRGTVDVFGRSQEQRVHLSTLGPGSIVGEMAVITDEKRSADVLAREDVEVEVITQDSLKREIAKLSPWMGVVVDGLARHLKAADSMILASAEKITGERIPES